MRYTVESTQDEFGTPRFFVLDEETADWVSDPFDTYEQASEEAQERNKPEVLRCLRHGYISCAACTKGNQPFAPDGPQFD